VKSRFKNTFCLTSIRKFHKPSQTLHLSLSVIDKMTQKDPPTKPEILAALQAILEEGVAVEIPGLAVAVYNSRGRLWESSAGFSNLENQTGTDVSNLFGIGSITKVFVAVVILQLVDEARLKL
jgi:D-alanyl-D-alanine carboxypeptidase